MAVSVLDWGFLEEAYIFAHSRSAFRTPIKGHFCTADLTFLSSFSERHLHFPPKLIHFVSPAGNCAYIQQCCKNLFEKPSVLSLMCFHFQTEQGFLVQPSSDTLFNLPIIPPALSSAKQSLSSLPLSFSFKRLFAWRFAFKWMWKVH